MTSPYVLYPRAFVQLSPTVLGRDVETGIVPTKASYTRKSFQQANQAEVTVLGASLPWGPMAIGGVHIALFMGAVDRVDTPVNDPSMAENSEETLRHLNLRFLGYADEFTTSHSDQDEHVSFNVRDYSSLFRDFKPVDPKALPRYSDSLYAAITRIMDVVSETMGFRQPERPFPVRLRAIPGNPMLTEAVNARGQRGAIQIPRDSTAWAIIEHVCGLVNRTATVELDEIVVKDPEQSYTGRSESKATFIFGEENANLLKVERTRKFARNRKGIRMTSWDPIQRRTLVAEVGDHSARITRPIANLGNQVLRQSRPSTGRRRTVTTPPKDEFEPLAAPSGITDQQTLERVARGAYEQRRHGELEGRLETPIWTNEILSLKHSDRFTLRVTPSLAAELRKAGSDQRRARMLADVYGFERDALELLMRASEAGDEVQYYLRSMTAEYVHEGISTVGVEFMRLLEVNLDEQSRVSAG